MGPSTDRNSFSVQGEGFETTRPETHNGLADSRTIPLELVQRDQRKIRSPTPIKGCLAQPIGLSREKTLAKQRDFEGNCAQKLRVPSWLADRDR